MNEPRYYVYACRPPVDTQSLSFWTSIVGFVSSHSDCLSAIKRANYHNKKYGTENLRFVVSTKYYLASKFSANQLEMSFDEV